MKVAFFRWHFTDLPFWGPFFRNIGSRSLIAISRPCCDCMAVQSGWMCAGLMSSKKRRLRRQRLLFWRGLEGAERRKDKKRITSPFQDRIWPAANFFHNLPHPFPAAGQSFFQILSFFAMCWGMLWCKRHATSSFLLHSTVLRLLGVDIGVDIDVAKKKKKKGLSNYS